MHRNDTTYYLDRPGARGKIGLGVLLVLAPVAFALVLTVPAIHELVLERPMPTPKLELSGMTFTILVGLGMVVVGAWDIFRGVRILRDRAPKLQFTPAELIDHRGRTTIPHGRISQLGYRWKTSNGRYHKAVITITLLDDAGRARPVEVDCMGLSASPDVIYNKLMEVRGE